jgi:RNA polymerase sigma-70 factor (ECF subfamily)
MRGEAVQDSAARSLVAGYEEFFAASKASLMGLAYLLTGDVQESQDLVQETLLRAWRNWPNISSYEDPKAWTRRVMHNLAIGKSRRARIRYATATQERPIASSEMPVGHLDVVDALRRLPLDQQRALVLHDVIGLGVAEVALELRAPEGTVRSWLSRGRAALAADLGVARHVARQAGEPR